MRDFPQVPVSFDSHRLLFLQGPHTCLCEVDELKQLITKNNFLSVFDMKCGGLKSCQPKLDKPLLVTLGVPANFYGHKNLP